MISILFVNRSLAYSLAAVIYVPIVRVIVQAIRASLSFGRRPSHPGCNKRLLYYFLRFLRTALLLVSDNSVHHSIAALSAPKGF